MLLGDHDSDQRGGTRGDEDDGTRHPAKAEPGPAPRFGRRQFDRAVHRQWSLPFGLRSSDHRSLPDRTPWLSLGARTFLVARRDGGSAGTITAPPPGRGRRVRGGDGAGGYAERIVLSHDAMCLVDWFPRSMLDALRDWPWTHIPVDVLRVMRDRGVSEADIQSMMVENPRTILEGGAPY